MRVFAVSDLHTDFKENLLLLSSLSSTLYRDDALIVAGDVADQLPIISETLQMLRSKFRRVVYTPGNHELWVRTEDGDSIEKLHRILALCDESGVDTRPVEVGGIWLVPLFSWYSPAFGGEETIGDEELDGWADFYFCRWPEEATPLPAFFLKMNEPLVNPRDAPVISFSHFLPRRDLLPDVERLRFKALPKVAGCHELEEQIRRLGSRVHVFGHSHIPCDRVIDGVRYVHNALGYPRERNNRSFSLKIVWDTARQDYQNDAFQSPR